MQKGKGLLYNTEESLNGHDNLDTEKRRRFWSLKGHKISLNGYCNLIKKIDCCNYCIS